MIYADSSVLTYMLHDVVPEADAALELLSKEEACTSLRTIEETTFVLLKLAMKKHYDIGGAYNLRRVSKKYNLNSVKEELDALRILRRVE